MSIASTVSSTVASTVGKSLGLGGGGGGVVPGHNLLTYSEQLDHANWIKAWSAVSPTTTANAVNSPTGTLTAEQLDLPAVSGAGAFSLIYQAYSATISQEYTSSVYLRGSVGGERVYLMRTPDGVTYDSVECVLTTSWQRFQVPWTATAGTEYFQIGVDLRDGSQTATTASTVYAWGAQLNTGPTALTYVKVPADGIGSMTIGSTFQVA